MRKAVIIMGPPGSGKGTQADLVASRFNLIHFDTGKYLSGLNRKEIATGDLVKPSFVLRNVKKEARRIKQAGYGIALSGSPRTIFEAFGDRKREGLIPFLAKLYGQKNVFIFKLEIPAKTSIARNSKRMVCSVCGNSHILKIRLQRCPFCGGKLVKRVDDKPKIIKVRLEEYSERTEPILAELKKRGFRAHIIDGTPKPERVFRAITKRIS
ncbi:MAG: nucleoside monophosphate kinase [Candidatus Colwellbacteria bacterium]|nr:nucleoside monophosphate kinase [Candidatus Colwellbacteria bacterium]